MDNLKKTIGIIGGMGPAATCLLFEKIINYTDAENDAEHIHILIDNYPQIPDRTKAILNGDTSPLEKMCEVAEKLAAAGADFLIIPCNTSHFFIKDIQKRSTIPVINMLNETAFTCYKNGFKKVCVLATNGTRSTHIYESALSKYGIEAVYPDNEGQQEVMNVIYNQVKAGNPINTAKLQKYLEELLQQGSECFILGCTELPIAMKNIPQSIKMIDSLDVLAKKSVEYAGYRLKEIDN